MHVLLMAQLYDTAWNSPKNKFIHPSCVLIKISTFFDGNVPQLCASWLSEYIESNSWVPDVKSHSFSTYSIGIYHYFFWTFKDRSVSYKVIYQ